MPSPAQPSSTVRSKVRYLGTYYLTRKVRYGISVPTYLRTVSPILLTVRHSGGQSNKKVGLVFYSQSQGTVLIRYVGTFITRTSFSAVAFSPAVSDSWPLFNGAATVVASHPSCSCHNSSSIRKLTLHFTSFNCTDSLSSFA